MAVFTEQSIEIRGRKYSLRSARKEDERTLKF